MNICYVGPCFDYSGYGEANRHFIAALDVAGVNVKVVTQTYVADRADFGEIGQTCRKLVDNSLEYDIKVLHVTPDQYPKFTEEDKYMIGHLFWETSRIPAAFVKECNKMNEIWTGSKTNADAIRESGVTVPIFVAPQPIEIDRGDPKPYKLPDAKKDMFLFYSIFEWTERKNPEALVRSFMEEFKEDDNVGLLIKTYADNFTQEKIRYIQNQLYSLRSQYGSSKAPVFVYKYLMDRSQIERFHATGDCYVTAHRGEGWGIPVVEAMIHGNPVITTGYNGVNEYLDEEVAHVLPYKMVGVSNNRNPQWYDSKQKWADVDTTALRQTMRKVYNDRREAREMGERGKNFVVESFNFKTVGKLLADRLDYIERKFLS